MWPTLDDGTLERMSGVELPPQAPGPAATRTDFWKKAPVASPSPVASPPPSPPSPPVELRVELAPGIHLTIAMPADGIAVSTADLRAIRAAAASLVTELATRRLTQEEGP